MNENILIEGLKNRNKAIFDFVFNYYYSGLCAFAMRYLNDRDVTEDLVQDFFVFLWSEGSRLQIHTSLKAYLFTAIKNRCLDFQRHSSVHERYTSYFLSQANEVDYSAEFMFAESELRTVIQRSVEKLTPRCREIYEMNRVKGLSNQVISEQLNISKRTVELQISIALKFIRLELADYLPLMFVVGLSFL
jgi:RNA polymerase sigma-70 factor (ECF subfamily)